MENYNSIKDSGTFAKIWGIDARGKNDFFCFGF